MRLAMPDANCVSVDVPTPYGPRRYQPDRSGSVEVDNPQHAKWLIQGADCFRASGQTAARAGGYVCERCSFRAFFTTCGRCGGVCSRRADERGMCDTAVPPCS